MNSIGVYYGTSTGCTEEVADTIVLKLNVLHGPGTALGPFSIDDAKGSLAEKFGAHDSLIVGTPTWNTGAETQRSGVAWDEVYYDEMSVVSPSSSSSKKVSDLSAVLSGKKVAVFGLGDSSSYGDNYCDATGELHDVFASHGAAMKGYVLIDESYKHEESKAVVGNRRRRRRTGTNKDEEEDEQVENDTKHFCGLLCDNVNQPELTEGRIDKWLGQLFDEGMLAAGGGGAVVGVGGSAKKSAGSNSKGGDGPAVASAASSTSTTTAAAAATAADSSKAAGLPAGGTAGWIGHYSRERKSTMWVNAVNRRESFVIADK